MSQLNQIYSFYNYILVNSEGKENSIKNKFESYKLYLLLTFLLYSKFKLLKKIVLYKSIWYELIFTIGTIYLTLLYYFYLFLFLFYTITKLNKKMLALLRFSYQAQAYYSIII